MHLVMFDIDGTLIESYDFDAQCYVAAIQEILGVPVDTDWEKYPHVTDTGIFRKILKDNNMQEGDGVSAEKVKRRFLEHLQEHISKTEIAQISGASAFLRTLCEREDVVVALATGGWLEAAQIKLEAAGVDVANIPMASSSDHHSRTAIMTEAERRTGVDLFASKTYIGDGAWDLKASSQLGFNFILVGDRIEWNPSIENFENIPEVLTYIGL